MKTIQIQKRRRKTMNKKEVSEITGLGHQLISDYYIKYKNKYEK